MLLEQLRVLLEDMFTYDETSIISWSHRQRNPKGTERDMDRLMLLLCCHLTGVNQL